MDSTKLLVSTLKIRPGGLYQKISTSQKSFFPDAATPYSQTGGAASKNWGCGRPLISNWGCGANFHASNSFKNPQKSSFFIKFLVFHV